MYRLIEVRPDGNIDRQFQSRRRVAFHRSADGYDADVTILESAAQAGSGIGAMFSRAMARLQGRVIRFHLDSHGRVQSVADVDAIWDAICSAIEAMATPPDPPGHPRTQSVRALASTLRLLPPDKQRALLASMVSDFIVPTDTGRPGGETNNRIVSIPATGPGGERMMLTGVEQTDASQNTLIIDTSAEGDAGQALAGTAPGSSKVVPGTAAHITFTARRVFDQSSGLLIEQREQRQVRIGNAQAPLRTLSLSTIMRD